MRDESSLGGEAGTVDAAGPTRAAAERAGNSGSARAAAGVASLIQQAAGILAEEVTARAGTHLPLPPAFRDATRDAVSNIDTLLRRVRTAVGELLDALAALAALASARPAYPSSPGLPSVVTAAGVSGALDPLREHEATVPVLRCARTARPGDVIEMPLVVCNDEADAVALRFVASDLVSDAGNRISADSISFTVEPAVLAAGATAEVRACLQVADGTVPGEYAGLVRALRTDSAHAVLIVEVAPIA